MKKYENFTFFYKTRNPFSNWYPAEFVDIDGNEYNCSEQFMMAEKARCFDDQETLKRILSSSDPKEQKELGRKVKNFDSKIWDINARDAVYRGCKLKFTQNNDLLEELLSTKGTLLVEASPYDKIWGIGLAEDNPLIHDPKNWQGKNWLGEVLTILRDDLLDQLN